MSFREINHKNNEEYWERLELVMERIRAVNAYIRQDVEGFQEEWLQCRRTDQERSIRDDKKKVEQAKQVYRPEGGIPAYDTYNSQ